MARYSLPKIRESRESKLTRKLFTEWNEFSSNVHEAFATLPGDSPPRAPGALKTFLQHCPDRTARRAAYQQTQALCSHPESVPSNINLAQNILKLRGEVARKCAYGPYSKAVFFHKAEKSPDKIRQFLLAQQTEIRPRAQAQVEQLAEFARERLNIPDFAPWDLPWVLPRFCAETFTSGGPPLAGRFPLARVLPGVFAFTEELFALKFHRAAEDANLFLVTEAEEMAPVGAVRVHLDPATAPGPFFSCCARPVESFAWAGKSFAVPVIDFTCTPPEAQSSAAALSLTGLVDFFHEMGHIVEMLFFNEPRVGVRRRRYPTDVVEFSSKFMEQFALTWEHCAALAAPDAAGQSLSREEFARAEAQYNFENTLTAMETLQHSRLDFEIGMARPARLGATVQAVQKEINFPGWPEYNVYTDKNIFGPLARAPLRVPTYTTNLYTYLFSEKLAQQAFDLFTPRGGRANPDLGRQLREEIFAAMDNFSAAYKDFIQQTELLPATERAVARPNAGRNRG